MSEFESVSLVEAQGTASQDKVAVLKVQGIVVAVVADGAGGTSGGARAASLVVERVSQRVASRRELLSAKTWEQVLRFVDGELDGVGQTTAVVAAIDNSVVVGASVGDSGAVAGQSERGSRSVRGPATEAAVGQRERDATHVQFAHSFA